MPGTTSRRKLEERAKNAEVLEDDSSIVADLHYYHHGYFDGGEDDELMALRYFSLLDTKTEEQKIDRFDGVWLAGRMSIDQRVDSGDFFATWVLPLPVYGEPDPASLKQVVLDYSMSSGLWIGQHEGKYVAIGGQDVREWKDDGIVMGALEDDRDGLRVLEADSFAAMLTNASWLHPRHTSRQDRNPIIQGDHPGCTTARHFLNNVCEFDGKTSAVFFHNRWYIYHRANVKQAGGRFVQVTTSTTPSVYGPYGPLQLISIDGYDPYNGSTEWSNIYYMVVNPHPWDDSLLIALMPVNFGEEDVPNGDGDSSIRMAFSCNGLHWSEMIFLTESFPKLGRTYDHPVDGFIVHNGALHWYLHRDVPNISPDGVHDSAIVEYTFKKEELMRLSDLAKASLQGCESPPLAPSPPATQSLAAAAPLCAPSSHPHTPPPSMHFRSPSPSPRSAPLLVPAPLHGMEPGLPSQQSDLSSAWQLGWGSALFAGLLLIFVGIQRLRRFRLASSSRGRLVPSSAFTSRSRPQDVELATMGGDSAATNTRLKKASKKFFRLEDETDVATAKLSVRVRSVACFFFSFLLFGSALVLLLVQNVVVTESPLLPPTENRSESGIEATPPAAPSHTHPSALISPPTARLSPSRILSPMPQSLPPPPPMFPPTSPFASPLTLWKRHRGKNCYRGHGAEVLDPVTRQVASLLQCKELCRHAPKCAGILVDSTSSTGSIGCWLRSNIVPAACDDDPKFGSFALRREYLVIFAALFVTPLCRECDLGVMLTRAYRDALSRPEPS